MTKNSSIKREVRARMEISGRSYSDQWWIVLAEHKAAREEREAEAGANKTPGVTERCGGDEERQASLEEPVV